MDTRLAEDLYSVLNSSLVYSFKKEPLPVFNILAEKYLSVRGIKRSDLPSNWSGVLSDLWSASADCQCAHYKVFESFKAKLNQAHISEPQAIGELVDFFADKYASLHKEDGGENIISKELLKFVYALALVNQDGWSKQLSFCMPFVGLCAFGALHGKYLIKEIAETEDTDEDKMDIWFDSFMGMETNQTNRLIGSVRLLTNLPADGIAEHHAISSDNFLDESFDGYSGGWTMVSFLPFGSVDHSNESLVNMTQDLVNKFKDSEGFLDAFFVLPKSFCYDPAFMEVRKTLVTEGLLYAVIDIPANFCDPQMEVVVIELMRSDSAWFVHGQAFINSNDLNSFIRWNAKSDRVYIQEHFEGIREKIEVESSMISSPNYCLLPDLYITAPLDKKAGEIEVRVSEFLERRSGSIKLKRADIGYIVDQDEVGLVIDPNSFSDQSDLLFTPAVFKTAPLSQQQQRVEGVCLVVTYLREKMLLCKTPQDVCFFLSDNQVAFKLVKGCYFDLDYIISSILRAGYLNRLALLMKWNYRGTSINYCSITSEFLNQFIAIHPDKKVQETTIEDLKADYKRKKAEEAEAEKQRAAHREVSSDLSHMLGTTFDKIGDSLADLKNMDNCQELAAQLRDNFDFMKRMLDSVGKDYSNVRIKRVEKEVNVFFRNYCDSWMNFGKNTFEVHYETTVSDETTFEIDEDLMKILLDTLFDNAYRHGFERRKAPDHQVLLKTSIVSMDGQKYVLLSVSNNGKPFPDDFTLQRYISRGEFCGESGRTGLGGNHVYSIAKRHDGFINLTSSPEWPVIIEVLIPVEYDADVEPNNVVVYANSKDCM